MDEGIRGLPRWVKQLGGILPAVIVYFGRADALVPGCPPSWSSPRPPSGRWRRRPSSSSADAAS
jgi:hypothetical protein